MGADKRYRSLRQEAYEANMDIARFGLAILTWGNASAFDAAGGVMAIKPSGVPYAELGPESMVLLDIEGAKVEGALRPSSDAPTHLELYRAFAGKGLGGVAHSHSRHATAWAQARRDIPLMGTTHADQMPTAVPCTPLPGPEVTGGDYERLTGDLIARTFAGRGLDPAETRMVLVAGHGPFTWGAGAREAVQAALILEEMAAMAGLTLSVAADADAADLVLPEHYVRRHFMRKHGPGAYYGQGGGA